jgi:chromosomal replication initiator protein
LRKETIYYNIYKDIYVYTQGADKVLQEENMDKVTENWEKILQIVKYEHELSDISFNTWLKPLEIYKVEGNLVTIIVPSAQVGLSYVSKRYKLPLQVTISEVTGMSDCEIRFILPEEAVEKPQTVENSKSLQDIRCEEAHLNPKYTFDTFVVGSNNKLAQAAALAVAESPGETFNPLFIYGGPGLGKTHLMHSIAHFIIEHDLNKKVLYVTSEEFTNELIDNIRNGNNTAMAKFREKYRNIDVLLVDDIQFIIGKESTQEEFFHTFNSLHSAGKQIILSSDKPPKEMEILDERFRSRFEWGIMADISLPDYETRMAILHKKEEMDGYNMKEEIIQYIANNVKSNIRELEGAFNKVVAFAKLEQKEISIDLAEQALADIISPDVKKEITPEDILSMVAEHYGVTEKDIIGNKRSSKIVIPRQIAMYLCRELTGTSLKGIGKIIGNRDHTTVMHGIEKIENELSTNESLKNTVNILKKKMNPQN